MSEDVQGTRPWFRTAVALYDAVYRARHRLDTAESRVGSVLRVEVRPSPWIFRFGDGTVVRRLDRIGMLHLNNDTVVALHEQGANPLSTGLKYRREMFSSLGFLASRVLEAERLRDVTAFTATTILHRHLRRVGFEGARRAAQPAPRARCTSALCSGACILRGGRAYDRRSS